MDMPVRVFGNAIKMRRKEMRLTQDKLAALLDVDVCGVQEIEEGKVLPSPKLLFRIARAMDFSENELSFFRMLFAIASALLEKE